MKDNLNKKTWNYNNPVEIYFGAGQLSKLMSFVKGSRAVLITTPGFSKRGAVDLLKKMLGTSLIKVFDGSKANPTLNVVKEAYESFKSNDYNIILALGGGSAIDTAKAVAAMGAAGESGLKDFLEKKIKFPKDFSPKPIIAIPTTAGSGSEVTMWASIWDMDKKIKRSISHPLLYPKKAVLDPELTLTLPKDKTIFSGLDALSHAMEAIWNKNHNPVSDCFSLKAIELVRDYLPSLGDNLNDINLRALLLQAGLMAGLAFSNTQTALAHAISYPLTAYFGLSHGLACSLPLPCLLAFNAKQAPERIAVMGKALEADTAIKTVKAEVERLFKKLKVSPRLSDYGVDIKNLELILESINSSGRANNNIVDFTDDELKSLLTKLF